MLGFQVVQITGCALPVQFNQTGNSKTDSSAIG
jgi:hypothetical protein